MSLEKNNCSKSRFNWRSPVLCTRKEKIRNIKERQEASFCTYQKASLTVEAAVVFPLLTGFWLSILFFFRVLLVQTAVEESLIYAGRMAAIESCLTDEESVLSISVEGLFRSALLQREDVDRYVAGGIIGVSLLESDLSGKEITLRANYMVKLPITLFGQNGIWVTSENSFIKWKGDVSADELQGQWVYITETGSVYHRDMSCRSLDLHIQQDLLINMKAHRGESGQKYYPCDRCIESVHEMQQVYFTDYGHLYHEKLSCSALKRTITKVLLSQVEGRRPCSFCY